MAYYIFKAYQEIKRIDDTKSLVKVKQENGDF